MPIKLICFDVDGTLLDDGDGSLNIWQHIHRSIGVPEELNEQRFEMFMAGEITYPQWMDMDVGDWRKQGITKEHLISVAKELNLMPGTRETVNELHNRGYKLAIISGSINFGIEPLYPDHPFEPVLLNRIYFDDEGNISSWKATPFDLQEKQAGLDLVCQIHSVTRDESAFIGDNFNDVEAAVAAGFSISFNSKSENLDAVADVKLPGKDLRQMLEFFPDLRL
ncbi:MAG: HAD family phosphatase [Planctomycetota bacterium]|nr:HAD family phosphatase [Planctomycetota bacterium]